MSDTPLMQAVAAENLELVQVLLESGITTGINDVYEHAEPTPLILAIEKQNLELIKVLLAHGAQEALNTPVKVLDASATPPAYVMKRPLQCAIETGNLEIVRLLIDHGASDGVAEVKPKPQTEEAPASEEGGETPAE